MICSFASVGTQRYMKLSPGKTGIVKNASWIIGMQVIKSLLGLFISPLTARCLGPSNYGLINYAASVVSFVSPIMYLGLNGILVQELVTQPEKEGETLGTSITLSFFSSLLCIAGVVAFSAVANAGEEETIIVCILYSVLLLFQSLELVQYWFQARLFSKYYSLASLGAYAVVSIYRIYLLVTGKSVRWFAVSNAIDHMLIAAILLFLYKHLEGRKLHFSWSTAKRLIARSRSYILSDMMVVIFAETDKIMVKVMVSDSAAGYYSAAVACSWLTGFVFSAIIDSFRPVVFANAKISVEKFERSLKRLYCLVIFLSLAQSFGITLLASPIIGILYGEAYTPAIGPLRLVVWYTTFSYLGSVRNIWMLAKGKQKYLWGINLSGALANVLLNWMLIPTMGAMGAALASLITQIFTNVIIGFVLRPIRENNRIMLQSLHPSVLGALCKDVWQEYRKKKAKVREEKQL